MYLPIGPESGATKSRGRETRLGGSVNYRNDQIVYIYMTIQTQTILYIVCKYVYVYVIRTPNYTKTTKHV